MAKVKFRLHILMGEHKIRSISQLSKETGLSRPTLTRIYENETFRVEFETVEKLCDFFDCDVSDLMYLDKTDNSK
jgi:putative transcriptional regulator